MAICDIAGLKVDIKNIKGRTEKQAVPYYSASQSENQKADITINVTPERIKAAMAEHPELNNDDWEYMLTGSDFYTALIDFDGILLHSSCVAVDGVAYAFSADSGTGKSTHTQLWLKHFGDRAHIVNDDKPAIRFIDGKVYACGTPWSGKYDYSTPEILPLGGICFLERSKTNQIKKQTHQRQYITFFHKPCESSALQKWKSFLMCLRKYLQMCRYGSLAATSATKPCSPHTTQ